MLPSSKCAIFESTDAEISESITSAITYFDKKKIIIIGCVLGIGFFMFFPTTAFASEVKTKAGKKLKESITTTDLIPSGLNDFEQKLFNNSKKFKLKKAGIRTPSVKIPGPLNTIDDTIFHLQEKIRLDRGLPLKISEESFRMKRKFALDLPQKRLFPARIPHVPYENSKLLQIRGGNWLLKLVPFGTELNLVVKSGKYILNFIKDKIKPEQKANLDLLPDFGELIKSVFPKKAEIHPDFDFKLWAMIAAIIAFLKGNKTIPDIIPAPVKEIFYKPAPITYSQKVYNYSKKFVRYMIDHPTIPIISITLVIYRRPVLNLLSNPSKIKDIGTLSYEFATRGLDTVTRSFELSVEQIRSVNRLLNNFLTERNHKLERQAELLQEESKADNKILREEKDKLKEQLFQEKVSHDEREHLLQNCIDEVKGQRSLLAQTTSHYGQFINNTQIKFQELISIPQSTELASPDEVSKNKIREAEKIADFQNHIFSAPKLLDFTQPKTFLTLKEKKNNEIDEKKKRKKY